MGLGAMRIYEPTPEANAAEVMTEQSEGMNNAGVDKAHRFSRRPWEEDEDKVRYLQ